jgi:pimeloyl-ACP methyl ester carboxylesterase
VTPHLGNTPFIAVDLPSCATDGDFVGDVETVRTTIESVDGPVVACGHSYGGPVITEAAAGLANVRRLVYLAAPMLDVGESLFDALTTCPPPAEFAAGVVFNDDGTISFDPAIGVAALERYCSPDVASWAAAQLRPQTSTVGSHPLTHAPWRETPSTFVTCTQDEAVPPELAKLWASRATETAELPTGHDAMLSMPADVAAILVEAARERPKRD